MRRVLLFDRRDNPLGELSGNDVFELSLKEEINGEHSLTITTTRVLSQGWRILTQSDAGKWREHVVYGIDSLHDSGERPIGTYYCVWSLQHDLMGTRVSAMPGTQTPVAASMALDAALNGTSRWNRGTVTETSTGGASMYDMDGWSALGVLLENWGGELDADITVSNSGVIARKASLYSMQGKRNATRRFDFGADLKSVRRVIEDGPLYCRITPRGKGEESGGGYGRKITIESVNDGKDYLENRSMTELAKLPDGNGGWEYPTLEVENSDCETPAELKAWGQSVLEDRTSPKITYTVDVMQLSDEGVDMHGVALGDEIHVVDRKFDGVRVSGRVVSQTVNLLDESDITLTIGNLSDGLASYLGGLGGQVSKLTTAVSDMNGGTLSTADYLSNLLSRINAEINATGGYTYITEGHGLRTYDKAVSDPLVGSEASSVVEIKGGSIRIANSRTSSGDWDWKSVFTSGHIAAELVTAARITTGYIGSSGDTFIDLDSHTVQLGQDSSSHTVINSSGIEMLNSSLSLAYFGSSSNTAIVRVGQASSGNVVLSGSGYIDVRNGSLVMCHFGYGETLDETRNTTTSPYYNIGVRTADTEIGMYSVAEGYRTTASGAFSHAGGYGSLSYGRQSFAHGNAAKAYASCSVACGDYVTTSQGGDAQAAFGVANIEDRSYVFMLGNGSSSHQTKSNACYVTWSGNMYIAGTLTQASDRRLKEHVKYLGDDAVEFVRSMKPALFVRNGERQLGFYAQDVQETEPKDWNTSTVEAKHVDESLGFDPLTLEYTSLIAPLVAYAQSLEKRIEALESGLGA